MLIKSATFVTSVANMANYPPSEKPEITFVGRSNVGKSSLINLIANQKALARTSSSPGRTRLVNLFDFNGGEFRLVDLPGYGYQSGAKFEAKTWSGLIERYLQYGMQLKHAFLLLDIRHKPTKQDADMISYLNYLRIPFSVIATKADQVPKTKIKEQIKMLDETAHVGVDNIIAVSALKGTGKDALLEKIESVLQTESLIKDGQE